MHLTQQLLEMRMNTTLGIPREDGKPETSLWGTRTYVAPVSPSVFIEKRKKETKGLGGLLMPPSSNAQGPLLRGFLSGMRSPWGFTVRLSN